jgi:hypothetical protein
VDKRIQQRDTIAMHNATKKYERYYYNNITRTYVGVGANYKVWTFDGFTAKHGIMQR